jgi:type VI secretion system FHA domain protein
VSIFLSWHSFRESKPVYEQIEEFCEEGSIGRAPDNHFVLHDPEKYVSRYHATIYEANGNWFVKDTSSTATSVNKSVVLKKGQQFLLSEGDEVTIGESVLRVERIALPNQTPTHEHQAESISQSTAPPMQDSRHQVGSTPESSFQAPDYGIQQGGATPQSQVHGQASAVEQPPVTDYGHQQSAMPAPPPMHEQTPAAEQPQTPDYGYQQGAVPAPPPMHEQAPVEEQPQAPDYGQQQSAVPAPPPMHEQTPAAEQPQAPDYGHQQRAMPVPPPMHEQTPAAEQPQTADYGYQPDAASQQSMYDAMPATGLPPQTPHYEPPPIAKSEPPSAQVDTTASNEIQDHEESLIFDIDDFFNDEPSDSVEEQEPYYPSDMQESTPYRQSADVVTQPAAHVPPHNPTYQASYSQSEYAPAELSQDTIALRSFLKELGMEPSQLIGQNKVEVMKVAGVVLRTLTEGMMGVLNARTRLKEKLELDRTQIRQEKNNPFKFSSTPEEALVKMLTKESGYMDPVSSATEAVDDAQAHELAMISGLNVAIQQTIESFDPQSLEKDFEIGFALSKKAKYWDIYCEVYESIAESAQTDSSNIFVKHFREHYELQISKLYQSD